MRVFTGLVLLCIAATGMADDAADAEQAVRDYFSAFSDRMAEKIAHEVYATPVQIGGGDGHRVLATPAAAIDNLRNLYVTLEQQNYRESVIDNLQTCVLSPTVALVDTRYSRIDRSGNPIPPHVRTVLYVLQKLDERWRIVSFYGHDNDRRPACAAEVMP